MDLCFGFGLRCGVRAIAVCYMVVSSLLAVLILLKLVIRMCEAPDQVVFVDKYEIAVICVVWAFILAWNYGLYAGATEMKAAGRKVCLYCQSVVVLILTANSITHLINRSIWDKLETLGTLGIQAFLWIMVYKFIRALKKGVYLPK